MVFMKDRMLHLKDKKGYLLSHVEMTNNRMLKLNLGNVRERRLQVNVEDKTHCGTYGIDTYITVA